MLRQREPRIRIPELLEAARGQACKNCGIEDGTVVAAHCNDQEFRGIGLKAHDCLVADLCFHCHDLADGRAGGLGMEERRALWDRAFKRTVVQWFARRVVGVIK